MIIRWEIFRWINDKYWYVLASMFEGDMTLCFRLRKKFSKSQTISTETLNFHEKLEFENNYAYIKYLVLLKNYLNDF